MLINQTNNNDGQVPELAKIFKDVHFNPNTNMWIYHEDEATYVCVSFHPYNVCKAITYVVLMLWLFVSFSLSNDRKIFSKCKRNHCQDPNAIPFTQEKISNLVFKKFGIVKGLGIRPSSSLVTTASSNSSVEYIQRLENEIIDLKEARARDQRLENEIIELKEARARDQEERVRDQEAHAMQEEVQKNILNFLRSKGYNDALTCGGGSTSS